MLDAYEQRGEDDLRALAAALVEPIAAELATEGGPGYLQLVADLYNRPNPTFEPGAADDPTTSLGRWRQLVRPLLSPEAVRLHRRFDTLRFAVSEVARRRSEEHTSELQSLMRTSYAVVCLTKKK